MATQPSQLGGFYAPTLYRIPGAPTVMRTPAGTFGKLSEEVVLYYRRVAARAINDYMMRIARASLVEVPKGPRENNSGGFAVHAGIDEPGSLAASQHNPDNDSTHRATAEDLFAEVSYDSPIAAVQHEGEAVMVHQHPIIPGRQGFFERTDREEPVIVEWRAVNYTTPGTKSHFLSDPFKEHIPGLEKFVYGEVRAAFLG